MLPACCRVKRDMNWVIRISCTSDAAEHKYIEECGAANFFGIKEWQVYHAEIAFGFAVDYQHEPSSDCARYGFRVVEERHIPVEELATFRGVRRAERLRLSPLSDIFTICRPKNRMITATR